MGEAISLRVQSLRITARSWDRLRRFALLTPSCGGPSADREEKRVTRGSAMIRTRTEQEQLDLPDPNQRGLLDPAKGTVLFAPRYHAADQKKTAPRSGLSIWEER